MLAPLLVFLGLTFGTSLPGTCTVGDRYVMTVAPYVAYYCRVTDTWTAAGVSLADTGMSGSSFLRGDGTWAEPSAGSIPAGLILYTDTACPAGWTELTAWAGKTVIATTTAAGDVGTTGGADSITPSAHAGTAVAAHASHTHDYSTVLNHTHAVNVTDNGHAHVVTSQTATTGGATSYEHGTLDTSSADAEATEVTASATTGITATTNTPAGGSATGTTAGPSASLTHSVTQPDTHAALDNRSAFVRLIPCKKD